MYLPFVLQIPDFSGIAASDLEMGQKAFLDQRFSADLLVNGRSHATNAGLSDFHSEEGGWVAYPVLQILDFCSKKDSKNQCS